MTSHSWLGFRMMFWTRSFSAMASPPFGKGACYRESFDANGIRQLVHVAGAGRKRGGQRVSQQLDGRDQARGGVAAPEIRGHAFDHLVPEIGRDLGVDAGVAEHDDLAPPRRHEDQHAVALARGRDAHPPERALGRGARVAPEPGARDGDADLARPALLGGVDRPLHRVEVDAVPDAFGRGHHPPDAPPPPVLPPPPENPPPPPQPPPPPPQPPPPQPPPRPEPMSSQAHGCRRAISATMMK